MTPSIQSHIERLRKATEFDELEKFNWLIEYNGEYQEYNNEDVARAIAGENRRLTSILRAYEQVILEQAEALELCSRENFSKRESSFHAKEAIASVEKILEEVK